MPCSEFGVASGARARRSATPTVAGVGMGGGAGSWRAIEAHRCSPTVEAVLAEVTAMAAGCPSAGAHSAAEPSRS